MSLKHQLSNQSTYRVESDATDRSLPKRIVEANLKRNISASKPPMTLTQALQLAPRKEITMEQIHDFI